MQLASKTLSLPAFIGVGGTAQRIGPGFLGMQYAPFTVQQPGQMPQNIAAPNSLGTGDMANERMRRRQRLFYNVEDQFAQSSMPHMSDADRENAGNPAQQHSTVYQKAFDLTVSTAKAVFETRNEPTARKALYGGEQNRFGMGCLLAAKLVERGVSCVEVDLGGWDNHANIFATVRNGNGPRLDQGMSGLVKDLVDRGLYSNTVVVWMGEFGRTPRINQNGGRDHWGRCWSVVVGGGAIKGGIAHGATTKDGMDIDKDPVRTGDLFATLYRGLGIDPATKVRDNLGRPIEIAEGKPVTQLL
jgi:uncharacterized protein (DUF1501 family)